MSIQSGHAWVHVMTSMSQWLGYDHKVHMGFSGFLNISTFKLCRGGACVFSGASLWIRLANDIQLKQYREHKWYALAK